MNIVNQNKLQTESHCPTWADQPTNTVVSDLLDQVCPKKFCSDVDRAILGASIGG